MVLASALVLFASAAPQRITLDNLGRLDLLPILHDGYTSGAVTSYDRTEGNDDGFSGKYSFVRKEGDNLVLADLKGPGCITRIHTPTPTDDILDFYFDGENKPRISLPVSKLFTGDSAPFVRPFVDTVGGGSYSYIPIPYEKSCKVLLHAPSFQFYDIDFTTYSEGTRVQSYSAGSITAKTISTARTALDTGGHAGRAAKHPFQVTLAGGKAATLFETKSGGRIVSLHLGPAEFLQGLHRTVMLRISWENHASPDIYMPAGDFFGYAWGQPAMGSALVGTRDGANYCNLPMPYDKAAKIELVSLDKAAQPLKLNGYVETAAAPRKSEEGHFYAVWHRENPVPDGKPFTWLDMKGKGKIVGLSVQAQGLESGNTYFFEGDNVSTIDGKMAVHGTGSEDFFNGGWYDVPGRWDAQFARPFSGCMGYQKYLGRTGGYRFFVNDAYEFHQSIVQTIEHGGTGSAVPADYTGVCYLYADRTPPRDKVYELDFDLPSRLIYSAHWTMPIEAFSLGGTTLTRGGVPFGDGFTRALSLRSQGNGDFDLTFVTLRADLPQAGVYRIYIDAVKGPAGGIVQLFHRETALGESLDLYSPTPKLLEHRLMGELDMQAGGTPLTFRLLGKNPASSSMGLDLMNIILERQ